MIYDRDCLIRFLNAEIAFLADTESIFGDKYSEDYRIAYKNLLVDILEYHTIGSIETSNLIFQLEGALGQSMLSRVMRRIINKYPALDVPDLKVILEDSIYNQRSRFTIDIKDKYWEFIESNILIVQYPFLSRCTNEYAEISYDVYSMEINSRFQDMVRVNENDDLINITNCIIGVFPDGEIYDSNNDCEWNVRGIMLPYTHSDVYIDVEESDTGEIFPIHPDFKKHTAVIDSSGVFVKYLGPCPWEINLRYHKNERYETSMRDYK